MPIPTDAACETFEYGFRDFRFPELRFPHTGISNTLAEAARDSLMEELEEILAGSLSGTNLLVHGDGGTEEDEEGGSQKGEAQE